MRRICRLLAGVAIGLSLLFTPLAPAAVAEPVPATVVLAQQPAPQPPAAETQSERNQRTAMGVAGLVLIGAVLLTRRMRKKPVMFVQWKKK